MQVQEYGPRTRPVNINPSDGIGRANRCMSMYTTIISRKTAASQERNSSRIEVDLLPLLPNGTPGRIPGGQTENTQNERELEGVRNSRCVSWV